MSTQPVNPRAPEKPDFSPVTIRVVDTVLRHLTQKISGGGGLWTKAVIIVAAAYANSGY
jgi:hypothetical protein